MRPGFGCSAEGGSLRETPLPDPPPQGEGEERGSDLRLGGARGDTPSRLLGARQYRRHSAGFKIALGRRRNGQGHRFSGNRPRGPALCARVRPHSPLSRIHSAAVGGVDAQSGGALHELRHSLLPQRLPRQQPDPRLERPGLSRRLAGGLAQPAHAPTISRNSPAASAPRLARRRAR